jgi:hypothetical protein
MKAIVFAAIVIVQAPIVKLVSLDRMHSVCGEDGRIDACTLFDSSTLNVECQSQRFEAAITFRPTIVVHDGKRLSHEYLHIDDFREYAAAYVTDIEQKRFETDAQCRSDAQTAMENFAETMREFSKRSMNHIH